MGLPGGDPAQHGWIFARGSQPPSAGRGEGDEPGRREHRRAVRHHRARRRHGPGTARSASDAGDHRREDGGDRERGPRRGAEHRAEWGGELDVAQAERGGPQQVHEAVTEDGGDRAEQPAAHRTETHRQEAQRREAGGRDDEGVRQPAVPRIDQPGRDTQPTEPEHRRQPRRRQPPRAPQAPGDRPQRADGQLADGCAHASAPPQPGQQATGRRARREPGDATGQPRDGRCGCRARRHHRHGSTLACAGDGRHGRPKSVDGAPRWGQLRLPAACRE